MRSDKNNSITIRYARAGDREALYKLWQDCFHDSDVFTDYYFDTYFRENRVLMLEDDGQLKAMLHLNPYAFCMGGRKLDSYYIVGVATDAEYRHRGAMTRLLKKVFEAAYAERLPFVYLMPADEAIYRPFQFAYIYAQQVEKKMLAAAGAYVGAQPSVTCRPAVSKGDLELIADMANACMKEYYDLYTWRDSHYFERLQKENQADGGELLMLFAADGCIGYLSYAMEKKIEVREVFCKPEWRGAAADWLMGRFAEAQGEVLTLSPNGFLCGEKEKRPIIMGRIVNLEEWIYGMPAAQAEFSMCLQVKDPLIGENNGVWQWHVSSGNISWHRTDMEPDICIEIDGLMQWLTGYLTLEQLETAGRLILKTDCGDVLKKVPVLHGLFINEIV